MKKYDVLIIGGGIAGLNIARLLGEYKLNICLVDSKSDLLALPFHTLGSFINIEKHNLSEKCIAVRSSEFVLHSKHIHIKKQGHGLVMNKTQIHKELLQQVIAHKVEIKNPFHVTDFEVNNKGEIISVSDHAGIKYTAKIFIDTSGNSGVLSKRVGLQDRNPKLAKGIEYNVEYRGPEYQTHLFMGKQFGGGYGWLLPLGNKRALLGIGTLDNDTSLKESLESMFKLPILSKLVKKDTQQINCGTFPTNGIKTEFVYRNLVCIGDSVSQTNPLIGEGYRFILETGILVVPYIYKALHEQDNRILKGYEEAWKRKFYKDYSKCKKMQKIMSIFSRDDLLSDMLCLIFASKRGKTLKRLASGQINIRNLLLF